MKTELLALSLVGTLTVGGIAASLPQALGQQVQSDTRGFNPPGTQFGQGNPFAARPGAPGADDEAFEEEEFEDFEDSQMDDISDEILRQRMEQRLRERAQSQPPSAPAARGNARPPSRPSADFGETSQSLGNTTLSGGANSQITPGRGDGCLKLDPYTGYGPDVITNFDFPDADIVEIAKTLGRLTCLNFILDKDVKGRISVVSNSAITVGDAWKAFLTALDVNGFTILPSGKYLRVARQRDAKDKQLKTYSGDFSPDNDLYITRVLPLKYINAEEVARVFRNFMPPNTRIVAYDQTNTLLITDTGANIKKLVDMIQLLDVEGFDEGLEVIRVKNASAQDIAKLIDQLLPGSGGGAAGVPPGGIPRFRTGPGFTARKTKEGGMITHVIPDERTNSLIISANAKGLEQVRALVKKLDAPITENQGGSRIHVVYLQFADAEQIAQTLNNLATGAAAVPRPPVAGPTGAPIPATSAALFEGAIKISADKATNSLVITGTAADFNTISRVIAKLDVPRDQVYVEAVVMEMSMERRTEIGTNIISPNSGIASNTSNDFATFLTNPLALPGAVLGFQGGKGSTQFKDPTTGREVTVRSVQGLVRFLQANSQANVLATPQILTLDNQEANIEISENIPLPTSTAVQGAGVATSYTYQKVALSLKIKPQINKISSFVKLDIEQKLENISDRVPEGVKSQAFGTTGRASKTTVVVQDGDTVAMGGLVRDRTSETHTKVPILGDIPILGWLFSSKQTRNDKTNLLVFITPKIIKQYQQVRAVLDKKIRQRDEFLEKGTGGEDPYMDYKLDLIKSLPPVSELKSGGRVDNIDPESLPTPGRPGSDQGAIGAKAQGEAQGRATTTPSAPQPAPTQAPQTYPSGTTEQPGQPVDSGTGIKIIPMQPGIPNTPVTPGTTTPPAAPLMVTPTG